MKRKRRKFRAFINMKPIQVVESRAFTTVKIERVKFDDCNKYIFMVEITPPWVSELPFFKMKLHFKNEKSMLEKIRIVLIGQSKLYAYHQSGRKD